MDSLNEFLVKATNSLCGGSSRLRYAFQDGGNTAKLFNIDSTSGTICLEKHLDYEKEISHQLIVAAIDQIGGGGLSQRGVGPLTAQYNITVREGYKPSGPLVVLSATDDDEGIFGEANVHVYVIDSDASAPSFTQPSYVIKTPEDILPGISIGAVQATGPGQIRYRFYCSKSFVAKENLFDRDLVSVLDHFRY
ncbi:hypothetical protein NECAME_13860 [Necator americanus]|uniref:Cadherin domain-containing protein n=1 Tax=Necator americanus TaxID=51031 RepID=W2SUT4_NECAM|nr:hypothetical protein NECAME_13860 [Necator americanus]ETN72462.1 hypothetical protein NECAME_13860 [Necator americanus]